MFSQGENTAKGEGGEEGIGVGEEKGVITLYFTPDNDIKYLKIYQIGANIC